VWRKREGTGMLMWNAGLRLRDAEEIIEESLFQSTSLIDGKVIPSLSSASSTVPKVTVDSPYPHR
jgi:hypothetical protein